MTQALPPPLRRLAIAARGDGPKHSLLSQALLTAISAGHWRTGERLPTETELAAKLPFSLGTVQRALRRLTEDGVLVRRQRSGTFVAERPPGMEEPWHCRFLDDEGGILPVHPEVIGRGLTREPGPWSRHLTEARDGFARIDRVIDVNREFSVHSAFYLDAARFPSFLRRPASALDGANFKHLLAREFGIAALRFAHTLQVSALPSGVCDALRLEPSTVGTALEAAASSTAGEPVYFQRVSIPPNPRRMLVADGPLRCLAGPESKRSRR